MYRISSVLMRRNALLMRRSIPFELRKQPFSKSQVSQAWFNRVRERATCPPKTPIPMPPLKFPFVLFHTGLMLLLTTGFMVYARNNKEVRDWLSINAPWFDDMIAVAFEENKSLSEGVQEYLEYFVKYFGKMFEGPPEDCQLELKGSAPEAKPVSNICDDDDDDDDEDENEGGGEDEGEEDVCLPDSAPTGFLANSDICEIEKCLKDVAEDVLHNYQSARDYCIYYNQLVHGTMKKFNLKDLKFLKSQMEEKEQTVEKHICLAKNAKKQFDILVKFINMTPEVPPDRLTISKQMAQDFADEIKRNQIEFIQNRQKTLLSDKQWKMVECLLDVYISETSSIYPELNWYDERPNIKRDIDFLLIHTFKYNEPLQDELIDVLDLTRGRATRAFEGIEYPKGKEKEKEKDLQTAVAKARTDMNKEFSDRMTEINKDNENELKRKSAEQKEKMEKAFEVTFAAKKIEAIERGDQMAKDKISAEKKILQAQLDKMKKELAAVEKVLKERLKAEAEQKRASQMHAASCSLLEATKKLGPRVKVNKELEILRKASIDDELVSTVLNSIPRDVIEKGVVPESVVRRKFRTMEEVALNVAMVEAPGAPLPLYLFSWIQSKILFMRPVNVPQAELDNPPEEPFQLDTFDLLQRARYYVQNYDINYAVRYVDAMEGASRGAAEQWYQYANGLLHTRQAAEAIIAHAASISLKYL